MFPVSQEYKYPPIQNTYRIMIIKIVRIIVRKSIQENLRIYIYIFNLIHCNTFIIIIKTSIRQYNS